VIRKPTTMKMKRKKKRQQDAVLKWIHSEPRIMVPEKRPEGDQCCQDEIRYIIEDEPVQPYPPK
ncbi:hypothetical protein A2U01_0079824, partial [Trifolium medium]|nr:hypothetical protein [Trifolium medium]